MSAKKRKAKAVLGDVAAVDDSYFHQQAVIVLRLGDKLECGEKVVVRTLADDRARGRLIRELREANASLAEQVRGLGDEP